MSSRYELLERIGAGGMAEIFRGRAVAVGGFEKPVAIKKILPHLGRDERFVRMLIAEAKILATFRQRNIVQIYDVGLGEDGEYFLVMEYVDGRDLGALFERMERERARFPLDLALHIGSEVCEALEHAHRAVDAQGRPIGLVHRDVSPSNVLLSRSGEVKLTDFGIAKKSDHASTVESLAGKFAYMSPEQARAERLDPRSDVYSLGVILWELLLGRRLFSGAKEFEALRLVREGRVTRPRDVDPAFPRELDALLMRALAPDPRQRYASAAQFGAALRDYRYSAATSAGDPAKQIAELVNRAFPPGSRGTEQHRVVRITTVAGFGDDDATRGVDARALLDQFDDPTRHAPALSAMLARDEGGTGTVTVAVDRAARAAESADETVGALAAGGRADTVSDDAETRMIDTRGMPPPAAAAFTPPPLPAVIGAAVASAAPAGNRDATPTVRDFPTEGLFEKLEGPTTPAPLADIDLVGATRRRAVLWAVAVTVVAAFVAFVIAGYIMAGESSRSRAPAPAVPPHSGEALDVPAIKPPVKKKPR